MALKSIPYPWLSVSLFWMKISLIWLIYSLLPFAPCFFSESFGLSCFRSLFARTCPFVNLNSRSFSFLWYFPGKNTPSLSFPISFFIPSCIRPPFPLPVNICHKASPFLHPERLLFSIEKWVHPSPFLMYCISIYCLFFFFPVENLPVPLRVSLPSSTGFRPFPVESSFPCF